MRAVSTTPVITQNDIKNGYVLRYFAKDIQRGLITEIDQSQLKFMINNPSYEVTTLRWIIGGNANDIVLPDGTTLTGAKSQNEATIAYYSTKLTGLGRILKNPLQYFFGIMNTVVVPALVSVQENYEVTVPTTTTTTAPTTTTTTTTTTIGEPQLNRNTLGRIAAYSSSPTTNVSTGFSTADWFAVSGISLSITVNGFLRSSGNVAGTVIMNSSVGTQTDVYIQSLAQIDTLAGTGVSARVVSASVVNTSVEVRTPIGFSGTEQLIERASGAGVSSDSNGTVNRTAPLRTYYEISGSNARAKIGTFAQMDLNAITTVTNAGYVGIYHSGATNTRVNTGEFYVMRSSAITVTGLLTGYDIQILSATDTVLASATESSGTATVDAFLLQFPLPKKIRVRDASDNTILTESPIEGIWGGDVWAYIAP